MPELRIDPICGRRVFVAEDRAGRPADYDLHEAPSADNSSAAIATRRTECPFCAGHEAATPEAVATVLDDAGRWRVRVVPNKYPAVSMAAADPQAIGAHEVVIESPDHATDLTQLDVDQLAVVLAAYRDRLRHWAADGRLSHGLVFKNSGFAAGASLEHIHSQFVALPFVPDAVQIEIDGAERFFASHGRCAYCDLIEREAAAGDRLVVRQAGYAAVCAYAGRQPYETWILPEQHASRFDAATDSELAGLATVLQNLLLRLTAESRRIERRLAYNLILHTGPFDDVRAVCAHARSYHWHWELIPRSTQLAGLEWGAGTYINPVSPERAATHLRAAVQ